MIINKMNFSSLSSNHCLISLSFCRSFYPIKLTGFSSLLSISLPYCNFIRDVSCLKNAYEVDLHGCPNITDISSLKKVNTLDLSCCQGIDDVSMLGKVKNLNLNSCYGITSILELSSVSILSVADLSSTVVGLARGNTIKKLTISEIMISELVYFKDKKKHIIILLDNNNSLSLLTGEPSSPVDLSKVSSFSCIEMQGGRKRKTIQASQLSTEKLIFHDCTNLEIVDYPFVSHLIIKFSQIVQLDALLLMSLTCLSLEAIELPSILTFNSRTNSLNIIYIHNCWNVNQIIIDTELEKFTFSRSTQERKKLMKQRKINNQRRIKERTIARDKGKEKIEEQEEIIVIIVCNEEVKSIDLDQGCCCLLKKF
jgi:hypothetical protein